VSATPNVSDDGSTVSFFGLLLLAVAGLLGGSMTWARQTRQTR
jgi:hypothetical protein